MYEHQYSRNERSAHVTSRLTSLGAWCVARGRSPSTHGARRDQHPGVSSLSLSIDYDSTNSYEYTRAVTILDRASYVYDCK